MTFPDSPILALWVQKVLLVKNKLKEQEKKKRKQKEN